MEKRVVFAAVLVLIAGFLASNIDVSVTGAYYSDDDFGARAPRGKVGFNTFVSNIGKSTASTIRDYTGISNPFTTGWKFLNPIDYSCSYADLEDITAQHNQISIVHARFDKGVAGVFSQLDAWEIRDMRRQGIDLSDPDVEYLDPDGDGVLASRRDVAFLANKIDGCGSNLARYDRPIANYGEYTYSPLEGRYCPRAGENRCDPITNAIYICDETMKVWVVKEKLTDRVCVAGTRTINRDNKIRVYRTRPRVAQWGVGDFFPVI